MNDRQVIPHPVTPWSPDFEAVDAFAAVWLPVIQGELRRQGATIHTGLDALDTALQDSLGVTGTAGRRWRPLLALAIADACAPGRARLAMDLATAVEMTHTASLILDDLPCMDDAPERRGLPAAHRRVGAAGAILLAIGLLGKAAELIGRADRSGGPLAEQWGHAIGFDGMAGGQVVDVTAGPRLNGAQRRLHRQKTTALVQLTTEGVGRLVGATAERCDALRSFGRHLGWSYQLADDAADREIDAELGRPTTAGNPAAHSRRHLTRALRRLSESGLTREGLGLVSGMAFTVVAGMRPEPGVQNGEARAC
jgi:geranylgeranyl diphosphate synthase type II